MTRARPAVDMGAMDLLASTSKLAAPAIIRRRDATFTGDLTVEDRRKLRAIVVKTHKHYFRNTPTNEAVDALIDALGPEVGRMMVMKATAAGQIG